VEKNQLANEHKTVYELLKKENFDKRLDELAKKFKNKKVLIYGAGLFSSAIFENYDLNLLNIIGVMDKKFSEVDVNENFYKHKTYTLDNINTIDFDVILILSLSSYAIVNDLLLRINKQKSISILIEPAIAGNLKDQIKDNFEQITYNKISENTLSHYKIPEVIKEYAGFPKWAPNVFMANHGWIASYKPLPSELHANKELMLVINKQTEKYWQEKGNKKPAIFGLHYIHYRKKKKIEKSPDSKGTIVFPAHGTPNNYMDFDIDSFCQKLKELPPKFHPVKICLGIFDFELWEKAVEFKKRGFEVVTAGSALHKDFIDNLYEIIRNHNYSISNSISTVTILALEAGLPFFLVGEKDLKMKRVRKNGSEYYFTEEFAYSEIPGTDEKVLKLFQTGPIDEITPEQKLFMEKETGLNDCISPQKLNALLWSAFIKFELKKYVDEFLRRHVFKQKKLNLGKINVEMRCEKRSIEVNDSEAFSIPVTIHNKGVEKLISSLPYPVYVGYHWLNENGEMFIHGEKTPIRRPIFQGQSGTIHAIVKTPRIKGKYILQISLLQDPCFWFEKSAENFLPVNLEVTIS